MKTVICNIPAGQNEETNLLEMKILVLFSSLKFHKNRTLSFLEAQFSDGKIPWKNM